MHTVRRLLEAAPAPEPARLLWRARLPPQVVAAHDDRADLPAVDLIEIRGVTYGGLGLVARDGALVHVPGLAPDYVAYLVGSIEAGAKSAARSRGALGRSGARVVRHDGPVLVPVHCNWIFGHVLMEVLPRALLLDRACPPDWPIAVSSTGPAWVPRLLRAYLPRRPFLLYRHDEEVVEAPVLVGCSEPGPGGRVRPEVQALLAEARSRLLAEALREPGAGPTPERIFVARAGVADGRHGIRNEAEVEAALVGRGFAVVRPEALSFAAQARLFDGARLVVGEYGSGLHNAINCRAGTTVVCLNWINGYQSRIAASFNQSVGYLAPASGAFRDAAAIWRRRGQMRIDVPTLLGRLDRIMARDRAARPEDRPLA